MGGFHFFLAVSVLACALLSLFFMAQVAYMENVDFAYPGKLDKLTLKGVSCSLCLGSRVVVLGANGAGKTTLIKLLVGETLPTNKDTSDIWTHHNLRVSYVAQHSFHHVEVRATGTTNTLRNIYPPPPPP